MPSCMKMESILRKGGKRERKKGGGSRADGTGKEREGEKNLQLKPWRHEAYQNHHAFVRPGFVPFLSLSSL